MIRDWAGRKPLRLDPQRVGLLLVDLQEEQRSDPNYAAHGMETVLANVQALLGAARLNGIAVFHSAYVRDFSLVPPRPFEPVSADGRATFSEFHLIVDSRMTVRESHVICDRIEDALKAEIPSVRVIIHVEPDDEAKLPKGTAAVPFA